MQCPKCQFENPEGIKFCGECGAKLEKICPSCNFSNPPQFKFCGECGQNLIPPSEAPLQDLPFNQNLLKYQRYLPKDLAEKILAQREKIEGERKQVTVMFCDLEGFTPLSEKVGPEEIYTIMDEVYEILIHKVHDYEGTVNEMTGDGIMALFGAPLALENAPQRAIQSALSIHREMTRFTDKVKRDVAGIPSLRMRIGVHTGPVVVGTLGNDLRVEFKAVGDTVNLASRMEGLAEPGSTYVTEETFKLTEGLFRFEALGSKEIKGKEEPVKVYRVIAPSTRRTRFDVSAERGLTPFVGREREMELLLDGFEKCRTGRGQAFSIISEAGVGKSRLLYEFRKALAHEDVTFLEGKCLSYSKGVAYHPIIDLLKANFDVHENDDHLLIRQKVRNGLETLQVDEATTLPYILELLSVKDSGIDLIPMSPEAKKDRIVEAVKRLVLKGLEIRPLIMAIEDLYWVDNSSQDLLKSLLENIPTARVLLIFTYRPDFIPTWSARSFHSQVTLNRLSNRESLSMVNHLLDTDNIDSDLEDLILEKTEGIPFFIEEFIRSLKDLKIIEREGNRYYLAKDIRDVVIPSTIQDVIMARVDSLPEGAKEVLQTGSAIEREFSYGLIKQVTGLSEQELLPNLSALKDSELLFERGIYPETSYIFKHAVTREVVYDSILTKRKKKLHEEIGGCIEELYRENIHEHYGILAEHFIEGNNYEKGAEYSRLTAKKLEKGGSLNDAIAYAVKRIACLERLLRTDDVIKELIDARTTLGLYYVQNGYNIKAKEAIEPIAEQALEINYKKRLAQISIIIGAYNLHIEENFSKAFAQLDAALKISEETNDVVSLFFAHYWLGAALDYNCDFKKALYHLNKALDINVAANSLWGIAVMKSDISMFIYSTQGMVDLGYKTSEEAIKIAEESGDIFSKATAHTAHGISCLTRGHLEEASKYLLKGIGFCERINNFYYRGIAQFFLAEIYFEMGEYQKSIDTYDKSIWSWQQGCAFHSHTNVAKICKARAMIKNHEKDINLESLSGYVYENRIKYWDGLIRKCLGETFLNLDDQHIPDARDWIEKAIEADKRNGIMLFLGMDYASYAELFKRTGDQSKARENLNKAIEIFRECGADGWVTKAEKELEK